MPPPNCDAEEAAYAAALDELLDAATALQQAQDAYDAKLAAANLAREALLACRGDSVPARRNRGKGRRAGK